ncbi:MAG: DsrE/DsrF/DrsH-like family protein [Chitinivibrionales bacterium]|nr:DsrE/DsrF/DrsH-like family protein [Chitinivibrionales bacterium]
MEQLQKQIDELKIQLDGMRNQLPADKLSMVVFSGSLDRLIGAFIIATGAAAMGSEVTMFFTFWATAALRAQKKKAQGKDWISSMFGIMLPKGFSKLKLSQMHMAGVGTEMIRWLMKKKKVASIEEMLAIAAESGVKIYICEMSMNLLGMKREEMVDYPSLSYVGVAKFIAEASNSRVTLFI